jgi:WD40 repeat protein
MTAAASTEPEAPTGLRAEKIKAIDLPTAVLGLDVAPESNRLIAACMDGGIYTVDTESGNSDPLAFHASYASGVAWVPGSSLAISAGYDGQLRWHDVQARRTIRSVQAHDFWSWQMAVSKDGSHVASVTGQYLTGGYKYEPAPEHQSAVTVYSVAGGTLLHALPHVGPVQSVAFSPDGQYLAAGNLMGEVRVWDVASGTRLAAWTTPDLTSWGIIKSHCYIGGIFGITFSPNSEELIVCGMGEMRDPMAGNGKQTWQRFAWRETPPRKLSEIDEKDQGRGLQETLCFHPSGDYFVMAGRLAQGKWNVAIFDSHTGALAQSLDVKSRVTQAVFSADGQRLHLGIARGQPKKTEDGKFPDFGSIEIYSIS